MNECHTLTQQNDENPKEKEPGMEIDEAGDILYTQKGKYYIRGITKEGMPLRSIPKLSCLILLVQYLGVPRASRSLAFC